MSSTVNKEARVVNGIGSALAVIGWLGFIALVVVEIVMLIALIDASEPLWTELQAFATVELLWIGMLALAAFGHLLRLLAAYTTARTSA